MDTKNQISVTHLKARLLEIVRAVERGASYEITKDNTPVAYLSPIGFSKLPPTGFAKISFKEDVEGDLSSQWEHDLPNIKSPK